MTRMIISALCIVGMIGAYHRANEDVHIVESVLRALAMYAMTMLIII